MTTVELPGGYSATIPPVLHSVHLRVQNIMRRVAVKLESEEDEPDFYAEVLLLLVESWTVPQPLTMEGIGATEQPIVWALWTEAMKVYRGEVEDPLPKA